MTLTPEHSNGAAGACSLAWLAEHVRAIEPEQRQRSERYQIRVLAAGIGLPPEFPHSAQIPSRSCARTAPQRVVDECSRSVTGPG